MTSPRARAAGAGLLLLVCCGDGPEPTATGATATGSGDASSGTGASGAGGGAGGDGGDPGGRGGGPVTTGEPLWSRRGNGLGVAHSVVVAEDGSVAVAGGFRGTIDFGTSPMTSAGEGDVFVARYDETGVCTWAQRFGGPLGEEATGVALTAAGAVLVTGHFYESIQIGTETLTSAGSLDVYVAELAAADGSVVRAHRFGGPSGDLAWDVAADADGAFVVAGESSGPVDFGGGVLVGDESSFVVAIDSGGSHVWSRLLDHASVATLDLADGLVTVGGSFSDTIDLGTGPLTSAASTDGFVARFDSTGNIVFAEHVGVGTSALFSYTVAVGPDGSVVLGGMASANGVAESSVALDVFSPDAGLLDSHRFGVAEYAAANAVDVDSLGNLVVAGFFRKGSLDLGCGPVESSVEDNEYAGDMFLAKLDPSGGCLWSKVFGGNGNHSAWGVAVAGTGRIAVAGQYQNTIDFGTGPLVAEHYPEPCVAAFGP